jgi:hypothetical protein
MGLPAGLIRGDLCTAASGIVAVMLSPRSFLA